MNVGTTISTPNPRSRSRYFYLIASLVVAAVVFAGFAKTYYLLALSDSPSLPTLLHVHGLIMTTWVALFITQSWLVSASRVDLHRRLGIFGALVAVAVLIVGTTTAIHAARAGHSPGPPPLVFLAIPIGDMVVFGVLVISGLAMRRRPDVHRRLMLLSTVGILAAAFARIPIDAIAHGGPLMYFGLTDLFVVACIAWDSVKNRRLHPAFLWGGLFVILSHPARLLIAGSAPWLRFAQWVTG